MANQDVNYIENNDINDVRQTGNDSYEMFYEELSPAIYALLDEMVLPQLECNLECVQNELKRNIMVNKSFLMIGKEEFRFFFEVETFTVGVELVCYDVIRKKAKHIRNYEFTAEMFETIVIQCCADAGIKVTVKKRRNVEQAYSFNTLCYFNGKKIAIGQLAENHIDVEFWYKQLKKKADRKFYEGYYYKVSPIMKRFLEKEIIPKLNENPQESVSYIIAYDCIAGSKMLILKDEYKKVIRSNFLDVGNTKDVKIVELWKKLITMSCNAANVDVNIEAFNYGYECEFNKL